ncbi:helix-turn-helix domain-containing protein [Flavihumibacter sp. UBA7668]|uniref:helix-turn-helix domain-containing protein n=1 Tax=Flavihumibacter sp. UBA7668 TaxID=1946542 RepID=UPI0025C1F609|nr:helix-turn-helix transcriptional regulator [Flavihumibacter sp. UBA7668]
MKIEEYHPSSLLKPYIKAYRIIESHGEMVNRVLPGTSFALAFRTKGQISFLNGTELNNLPVSTLSGLRKSIRLIHYAPQTSALIVLFKETGVPGFLKQPLQELFEESISMDTFFHVSEIASIGDQLALSGNNQSKISIIEKFLISKLDYNKPDNLVLAAIDKIYQTKGIGKIKKLSDSLFISQDAFEKRFRKITGASPKQFSSIVRMKAIIEAKSPSSLLDISIENGYYDPAHLIKDFKQFTGITPTVFFNSAAYW